MTRVVRDLIDKNLPCEFILKYISRVERASGSLLFIWIVNHQST